MPYIKYSAFWSDSTICYYWEVPGGGTESTCMFGDKGETSSCCKTKYEKLPQSLKSCLDYCALVKDIKDFYLGHKINKDDLIRLMVAEGLIEEKAGEGDAVSLEEIASSFIDELICLEMLIIEEKADAFVSSSTWIKVSEAYYKLCVVEGNHDDFVARNSHSPIRVFARPSGANDISPCLKNLPIQSLFLIFLYGQASQATIDTICGMRSLLVLEMISMSSNISFNGVEEMVNLRFLRFSSRGKFLPTFGNLQKLQTLVLTCQFDVVPEEVIDMLSNVFIFWY